ncbi:MAG: TetR/AcrR family transcriptional regulator [Beduini sp.]|uniref:TetR/AcrR family transcriptional regulator n=1 Tax=Beduini sp. TaxID=1922300 RepID=UPI003990512D
MPKGFSEEEKKRVKQKLFDECKACWQQFGYKKTSIDMLCQNIVIAKGSFYHFYESKEALFYEVITQIQEELYETVEDRLKQNPSKYGVALALKEIYGEYITHPFMYDNKSPDFLSFINKLSENQRQQLNENSYAGTKFMLNKPFLKLKIEEALAISVLSAALNTIVQKDEMLSEPKAVFDFMIDHLIEDIFE